MLTYRDVDVAWHDMTARLLKSINTIILFCWHVVILLASLSSEVWLAKAAIAFCLPSPFPNHALYQQSPAPSMCCLTSCCSLLSSHTFQISLNAILPSHCRSYSPPFPSIFWTSDMLVSFSSLVHSTQPANFNLLLTNFFPNLSFTSTSTYTSSILVLLMYYREITCYANLVTDKNQSVKPDSAARCLCSKTSTHAR